MTWKENSKSWGNQTPQQSAPRKGKSIISLTLAGVALVAIGIASYLFLNAGGEKEITDNVTASARNTRKTNARPATVNTNVVRKARSERPSERPAVKPAAEKKTGREIWMGKEIVSTKVVTNGTDLIITRVDVNGKTHKEYTSIARRLFKNPVDIVLAMLLTTPEGAPMPPLPPLGSRANDVFIAALKSPIEITDEDNEGDRHLKRMVIAAREEMLEEVLSGRSVNDIIEDHCTYSDKNNTLRADAMAQYKAALESGDEAMAEELRGKINTLLTEKGIKPIKSYREITAERRARRNK